MTGEALHGSAVQLEAQPAMAGMMTIEDIDLDIQLVDLVNANQMVPVTIDSVTAGGVIEKTTYSRFNNIRITGNFGSFGISDGKHPIQILSVQKKEGAIWIHPQLSKWFNKSMPLPGFVLHE
jgi:hypothetical protein